jgi:hypothetical protein
MQALAALNNLIWFRGEPPYDTVVYENDVISLECAVWRQIEAARPQLTALVDRDRTFFKVVREILRSIEEQKS